MAVRHVLKVSPRTVQWGVWDARLEPVLRVKSGDVVEIHTISGEPEDLPPANEGVVPEQLEVHAKCRRGPGPHFLTGPVWVECAEPGDALEVRIREVSLRDDWGWNLILPLRGTLPEDFPEARRMHLPIDRRAMTARLPWGTKVPLRPFFGNFGVAPPARYGAIDSLVPREHGGNMDNKELVAGTTVYFPVWNHGALFSAGDGHAAQGDGEVCLTAIETGLTGVFELIVRKDLQIGFPRAESPTHYISMGMHEDLDDAAKQALRHMIDWITELTPLTRADAYSLCSIAADLRVTQLVDGNKGIHCVLPKTMLET
jgi:acetamidase/formamidase